ncbi:DUF5011 domain-containing protein [Listeria booriae]|uniref:immunoglobulin-like domain-containing protein n=1 Tax=Listeria booriae TaxID=1552123 RepID=UPI00162527D7|nr:immunoglobulin-like domain-containing protein [Listeria booriae]MBC2057974.1 DUF5011 domain-containing protein [Listeria booriae]
MNLKKKIVIASLTLLVVGGGTAGIVAVSLQQDAPAQQAERKVKQVAEERDKTKRQKVTEKEERKVKDVLGNIIQQQDKKSERLATVLDPSQGNRATVVNARDVALKAIAVLPDKAKPVIILPTPADKETPVIVIPSKNDKPIISPEVTPPVIPEKPVIPPVVPPKEENTDDENEETPVNPKPEPVNTAPQIVAENQQIHVGDRFNAYQYASATDAEDGDLSGAIEVIQNNVNPDREGTYHVTYKVTDSKGAFATVTITVYVMNDAPVIYAADQQLSIGEVFDPMKGVTATDTEDGDVTSRVVVTENTVDTERPGTYRVTYMVQDSHGKAGEPVTIQVNVINDLPILNATDLTLTQGDVFDPLQGVTATDKQDGELTSKIEVIANNVDTNVPGRYEVTYRVTDAHGGSTEKTIAVTVKGLNESPQIQLDVEVITVQVGEAPDWLAYATASDAEDGDITALIQVDASAVDLESPGDYMVMYQVTDSEGVTTSKHVPVKVLANDVE